MPAAALPAVLPVTRAKASAGSKPTAPPQGRNKLNTLENMGSPFQSNVKCAFCHCKHPGIILHAPTSLLLFANICIMLANIQLQSALVPSLLPMKGGTATLQGKSLALSRFTSEYPQEMLKGCSVFLHMRSLCILWK